MLSISGNKKLSVVLTPGKCVKQGKYEVELC